MFINNLSKEEKVKLILEDNKKKKITISNTIFPKEKLQMSDIVEMLSYIIDDIGYIADFPNVIIDGESYNSKTIIGSTIEEVIGFISKNLNTDESIGLYQIGFDKTINKYSIRVFFYTDIGRKVRRIRETKINSILN